MALTTSWWLLLLVPSVLLLLWFHRKSYARLERWAKPASIVLRGTVLLLLVLALADPHIDGSSGVNHHVVLIDVSSSVSSDNIDAAIEAINTYAQEALERSGAVVSVIVFGEQPHLLRQRVTNWEQWSQVEISKLKHNSHLTELQEQRASLLADPGVSDDELSRVDEQIAELDAFVATTVGGYTSIERALRLGCNMAGDSETVSLLLMTDGAQNLGDWRRGLQSETELAVVNLNVPGPPEVLAASIETPERVRVHQTITPTLVVTSNAASSATFRVFSDGYAVEEREVELVPGDNRIGLQPRSFETKGFHSLSVLLEPAVDTELSNNAISTLVAVPGKARVLYVDSDERHLRHLTTALELEGIDVDARPAAGVPQSLSELLGYDALILSNIPSDVLGNRQMQMIRSYVRDFGGGFVMLGGDQSFGLGGYFKTPIEEILPVSMPIQKDLSRPSLAICLVIDKSGSMDGVKIELAKRAALATAEVINPRDQIGVIGFDGNARQVLPLTFALDRTTIRNSVSNLAAGGGTNLFPALRSAQQSLNESVARRKHILILSDGQTQGFGYQNLAREISADGITISTVGIGEGADMDLMDLIASLGGGRSYFTNDFFSIPQIFTREALRAANNMLVERLVVPIAVADDPALMEIDIDDLPILTGYVATGAKSAAETSIVSDSGDPLLARWRFGLGTTVAFMSETKPRWAESWLDWRDFTKFWGQLVRSVTGDELAKQFSLVPSHRRNGDTLELYADAVNEMGEHHSNLAVTLDMVGANNETTSIQVEQVAPGRFMSRLGIDRTAGEYRFVWHGQAKDDHNQNVSASYVIVDTYPLEVASIGGDTDVLQSIADQSGIQISSIGTEIVLSNAPPSDSQVPIWPYLLTLAAVIIPLDILVRRIG